MQNTATALPFKTGKWLSWKSVCFASRRSTVRVRLSPLQIYEYGHQKVSIMAKETTIARGSGASSANTQNVMRNGGLLSRSRNVGYRPRENKSSYEESEWREAASTPLQGLPFMTNRNGSIPLGAGRVLSDDHYVVYEQNYKPRTKTVEGYLINVRDKDGKLVEVRRPGTATRLNKAMRDIVRKYKK